jgi:hypothetical protein
VEDPESLGGVQTLVVKFDDGTVHRANFKLVK